MTKMKPSEIVAKIVDMLEPLAPEDRQRIIQAALALLGDVLIHSRETVKSQSKHSEASTDVSSKVSLWMEKNDISMDQLEQVFHIADESIEVIANVPGKNGKEKTHNAYILTGIASFISTSKPNFTDKAARDLCISAGCYDNTNHATYMKGRGKEFTGTKEKGWTLTTPGLKQGAALIKEILK